MVFQNMIIVHLQSYKQINIYGWSLSKRVFDYSATSKVWKKLLFYNLVKLYDWYAINKWLKRYLT